MKHIITFILLFVFATINSQNTDFGTLTYIETNQELKVFYSQEPQVDFDSIPIEFKETIWHYSYNPFCFDCGQTVDTLSYGDTLYLSLNSYDRVWAETRFYRQDFNNLGYISIPTQSIVLPQTNKPWAEIDYPNPSGKSFTITINTNGYKFNSRAGGLYYAQGSINNDYRQITVNPVVNVYPGIYIMHTRIYFNHPLLKSWLFTTTKIII